MLIQYVSVVKEFWGKTNADCYQDIVKQMLTNFQALGARISIKIPYIFGHLGRFPKNLGEVSEEKVERFHQAIKIYGNEVPEPMGLCYEVSLLFEPYAELCSAKLLTEII